jgi:hypothetical protein
MKNILTTGTCTLITVLTLSACGLNPQSADTDLNVTLPEAKITVYNKAINRIGMMHIIYGTDSFRIMSNDITDNTGTSSATQGEIPRDITEMVKSTLNAIGEGIIFIPYDPGFMQNTVLTGYTDYSEKLVPDVMVSGGITEFDRGLVTKGDELDLDIEFGNEYGINFADQNKNSLANITLDFNLIDFKTFAGIPRIQAINGIKVHKGLKEDAIGFTVKSATFGVKGTMKKVQGRHAAVRLLVQLSMVQIIGRYQKIPYWRLIPGATADDVVLDMVISDFYDKTKADKIATMQSYLYLHGYDINITGVEDDEMMAALQQFASKNGLQSSGIDEQTFMALYESIPLDHKTKQRRKTMPKLSQEVIAAIPKKKLVSKPLAETDDSTGQLKLWTNRTAFSIGETMDVNFSVDEPMYVRIVVINSQGLVSTLFPNPYQSDNYLKPGKVYQIPPKGADFTLDIGGPSGTDKIRAIASKKPIPAEAMYFTEQGDFDDSKMANLKIRASSDIQIN